MSDVAHSLTFAPRFLFLSADPQRVRAQLAGEAFTLERAAPLRDDVSTDEITPVPILTHYDDELGRYPYTGFKAGGDAADRRRRGPRKPASR